MADIQRLDPIKTAHGVLKVWRDWDCEGAIRMKNAKTIKRYMALMNEHPDCNKYGIFWAFDNKQFDEGKARMKELGLYEDGQKIYSFGNGGFGISKEQINAFFGFYAERNKRITKECDPQEVYIYEYNNHECMLSWDGDGAAYKIIVDMYGEEVAKSITRFN